MILDPTGIPMVEWIDRLTSGLKPFGTPPILIPGMSWQDWAAAVLVFPPISGFAAPSPYTYDEWLPWAYDFNKAVNLNL